jgi:Salmonella virulence plasmid 65kDa B protein
MEINIFSKRSSNVSSKIISLIIILVFNFSPVSTVFAAASSSETTGVTSSSTDSQDTSTNNSNDTAAPSNSSNVSSDSSQSPSSPSAQSESPPAPPPSPPPPSGGGGSGTTPTATGQNIFSYQSATPQVDGATGALTQKIQLDIPPGRNGMQPDLSLVYNSRNTDQDSVVGYGWSLSIPFIERLNKAGSQDLYGSSPYFTSSLVLLCQNSGRLILS